MGYNVLALSHTLSGKLPGELICPIPTKLPFNIPSKLQVLRRCTLILSDPSQNHRIASLASTYDILALRPTNEKTLQQACQSLECDIISLDLTERLEYHFKMKMLSQAVERGIKIEICYAPGVLATDSNARRNVISNATQLIRATRGRGLIVSSGAQQAVACRGPADIINLAAVWGLGQEKGKEAVSHLARSVVVSAQLKRNGFRGAVDVVYGGEKPEAKDKANQKGQNTQGTQKRKHDDVESRSTSVIGSQKTPSKRELKRQKKVQELQSRAAHDSNAPLKD